MLTNADITIYSKYFDSTARMDKWVSSQIKGVSWFGKLESTLATTGMLNADVIKIRIPINADFMGKAYIEPLAWANLADTERSKYWTIQKGDFFVKGLVSDEITATFPIGKLQENYCTGKIVSIGNNRRGSPAVQHWAVTAE